MKAIVWITVYAAVAAATPPSRTHVAIRPARSSRNQPPGVTDQPDLDGRDDRSQRPELMDQEGKDSVGRGVDAPRTERVDEAFEQTEHRGGLQARVIGIRTRFSAGVQRGMTPARPMTDLPRVWRSEFRRVDLNEY
ncbi:hypothetical protein [Fodinicola acaciae]|uniref:hypothetical protein n=1 Tax=Fodinicola acaciae TaxID=2681555 RepID=UPI0013D400D5|nr:hypothetical protein [Fodinicola acaciae]